MKKQDRNNALKRLVIIQNKLLSEAKEPSKKYNFNEKLRVIYQIEKTYFNVTKQDMPDDQITEEDLDCITNYEWVKITCNYINYCRTKIMQTYKLKKLYKEIQETPDEEIQKKFYKIITQIQEIKKEEIPDEDHIDEVMKYYDEIFHQSKQIITHKRNILENLIFTKEKIIFTKGDYNL